jgi:tellurite resistance protein
MPMLRSCCFPDCETLTLSPHCYEHEQLIGKLEADRRIRAVATDAPTAREIAEVRSAVAAATP